MGSPDQKRILCIVGTIIVMISTILLFLGSLSTPWEIQTWDGNSLEEIRYRDKHSFYARTGLLLLIIGSALQIINLLKKKDIKWARKIFKDTKK